MIDPNSSLSIVKQCELLGISHSSYYYKPKSPSQEKTELRERIMAKIDEIHTQFPVFGQRKIRKILNDEGINIGRKLVRRYMQEMCICPVYPKPNLSKRNHKEAIMPYLLKTMDIFMPNQVWSVDITYVKMHRSHMYLTAVIDWYSRRIVGWSLSDTLDTAYVIEAVQGAIDENGAPGIINSDQGSQFTSNEYKSFLKENHIRQSMDGKSRWADNIMIERWFRSLKTEMIYINEFNTPKELRTGIRTYINDYNEVRPHESLDYATPNKVYYSAFNRTELIA